MSVIFHVCAAVASTALVFSIWGHQLKNNLIYLLILLLTFVSGILLHGLLDITPHQYPLKPLPDIFISSILISCILLLCLLKPRILVLTGIAIAGNIFPDIIDMGPILLHQETGIDLRFTDNKIFPWHTPEFSGSIYDGSRTQESHFYHSLLIFITILTLVMSCRKYKE